MAISHKLSTLVITFFFLLALAASKVYSATEPVSFSFPRFRTNDNIILQGTAEIVNETLALTKRQNPTWTSGCALYSTPVPLWYSATGNVASFVASFSFVVESYPPTTPTDGLVFFLAPKGHWCGI